MPKDNPCFPNGNSKCAIFGCEGLKFRDNPVEIVIVGTAEVNCRKTCDKKISFRRLQVRQNCLKSSSLCNLTCSSSIELPSSMIRR